jgi:hypothetical protein
LPSIWHWEATGWKTGDRHEPAIRGTRSPAAHFESTQRSPHGIVQLVLILLFIGGAFVLYSYLAAFENPPEPEAPNRDLAILVRTQLVSPRAHALRFSATGTVQVV